MAPLVPTMSKEYNENRSWEENQNYKKYKRAKMSEYDDLDFFQCYICDSYKDSFDQSDQPNVCLDCFLAEKEDEQDNLYDDS